MKNRLTYSQRKRLDSIAVHLKINKLDEIQHFETLIGLKFEVSAELQKLILWLVIVGNYPSKEENYLLEIYAESSPEILKKWLKMKRRSYVLAGMPRTYIQDPIALPLFDVSETCDSAINSGIQRIVRETAKQLKDDVQFVRWEPSFGILTTVSEDRLDNVLNWTPHDSKMTRLRRSKTEVFSNKFDKFKKGTINFLSYKGKIGHYLLAFLKFLYSKTRLTLSLRYLLGFRPKQCLIFQPSLEVFVLELQSLDLRILERVNVQIITKLFRFTFLVHDTLPLRLPDFFPTGLVGNFSVYLKNLSQADNLLVMADSELVHLNNALSASGNSLVSKSKKIDPPFNEIQHLDLDTDSSFERFNRRQILIVGSLEPRKNHVRMIKAIVEAAEKISNIRVVFVIPNEWLSQLIRFEISRGRSLGIEFELHHSISDAKLNDFYRQSSVLMYCSLAEGLGLPLLEARSFSLPTLTSNRDFMLTVATTGGAVAVDPLNLEEMSNELFSLLSDFEYWKRVSASCKIPIGIPWKDYASQFSASALGKNV